MQNLNRSIHVDDLLSSNNSTVRSNDKQSVWQTDEIYPQTKQQEDHMGLPYGLVFQPFVADPDVPKESKQEFAKCQNCGAYVNMYCKIINDYVQCCFCNKTVQTRLIPQSSVNDYAIQCRYYQNPLMLFVIDITEQSGFEMIKSHFRRHTFKNLMEQIEGLRVQFCFFGAQFHYIIPDPFQMLSFPEFTSYEFEVPLFTETYEIYKQLFNSSRFKTQLFNLDTDTRCSRMALEMASSIMLQSDQNPDQSCGGLVCYFIAFGPDELIDNVRDISDTANDHANIDCLQSFIPETRFDDLKNSVESNFAFHIFIQSNQFIDASNYEQLCRFGSFNYYQDENPSFEYQFGIALIEFEKSLVNINLKIVSKAYQIKEVYGKLLQVSENLFYAPFTNNKTFYSIAFGLNPKTKLSGPQYLQIQFVYTDFQKQCYMRIITVQLQTGDSSNSNKYHMTTKLLLLAQLAAQAAMPKIIKETDECLRISGGFIDVRDQLYNTLKLFINKQNFTISTISKNTTVLFKSIFSLMNSDLLRHNVPIDFRVLAMHNVRYGSLQKLINIISPITYICPLGGDTTKNYTGSPNVGLLSMKSKFAISNKITDNSIAVLLSQNLTQIVVVIDDLDENVSLDDSIYMADQYDNVPADTKKSSLSRSMSMAEDSYFDPYERKMSITSEIENKLNSFEITESIVSDENYLKRESSSDIEFSDSDQIQTIKRTKFKISNIMQQQNVKKAIDALRKNYQIDKRAVYVVQKSKHEGQIDCLMFEGGEQGLESFIQQMVE
ncbi:Sec24 [Hexamita inflata]|uniref:Sec24 n=1 Tax=Hexamita inflata TaxID=28002 RepID=A0AA86UW04_9EUKA|nr:Sec24 [Hexamita inflata]